jgi:hypothetical protein
VEKTGFLKSHKMSINIGWNERSCVIFRQNKKACQSPCRLQNPGGIVVIWEQDEK